MSAASSNTLAEYFENAGIADYAPWAKDIRMTLTPVPHQVPDLNHLAAFVRSGLWNEMGTGKTLPIQAHVLWLCGLGNKAVVLMPPTLLEQFRQSLLSTYQGISRHVSVGLFMGGVPKRQKLLDQWEAEGWPDILLTGYQMFTGEGHQGANNLRPKEKAKLKLDPKNVVQLWQPGEPVEAKTFGWWVLAERGYTQLTVDEATVVKTHSSGIHQAVWGFVKPDTEESNGLTLVTGTPVQNTLEDLYGLIRLLLPKRYGSFRHFERTHVILCPGERVRTVIGYANKDYLWSGLYAAGRRVLKKDVIGLPEKVFTEIPLKLSDDHKALYRKVVNEQILEFDDGSIIDATSASKLYQVMRQVLLNPEQFTDRPPKENVLLQAMDDILSELGDDKVLVFAWYQASIEKLAKKYAHLNPATLYGATTDRDAQRLKFINDPTCKMMIANPRSGGVGVDGLQAVCTTAIFAEMVTVPGDFRQAVDRLHRKGQTGVVNVYLLVPRGTIAVKLRNDLVRKEEDAASVTKDKATLLKDLLGEEGIQGTIQ
jgi:hypothetical protein